MEGKDRDPQALRGNRVFHPGPILPGGTRILPVRRDPTDAIAKLQELLTPSQRQGRPIEYASESFEEHPSQLHFAPRRDSWADVLS